MYDEVSSSYFLESIKEEEVEERPIQVFCILG
jgi:hypothetical protein